MKNPCVKQIKLSGGSGRRYYSIGKNHFGTVETSRGLESSETAEALIIRFLNGDTTAFNTLIQRWQKPIYNFVLRYAPCPDSASDLTQQTFFRAYKGLL